MQKQTIPLRVLNGPAAPPAGAAQKFWNIVDVSDEEAEITMYGEVVSQRPTDWWTGEPVEGLYITPEAFSRIWLRSRTRQKSPCELTP